MVKVKEDMTGWKMWEHGVPDSKLIVVEQIEDYVTPNGTHYARYLCKCRCGSEKDIKASANNIRSGHTISCGCSVGINGTHKLSHTRLYSVWNEIKQRCSNPNCPTYDDYGGRGICVCDDWQNDFMEFRKWALSCGYEESAKRGVYTVERIDNNGNYCPENCTITSMQKQAMNRRKRKDNTSEITGVSWAKQFNVWRASITINKKRISLGSYKNKTDAIKARLKAELEYLGVDSAPQRHLFEQYKIN